MTKYNKEDYPILILVDTNETNNNIVGYLLGDKKKVRCPKLIINDDIQIMFFRGYYWTDNKLIASNEGLVSHNKNSEFINDPVQIINSVLKGINRECINFNEDEMRIIVRWYNESKEFHMDIY